MSDTAIVVSTAASIIGVVVLIVRLHVNPVVALVVGAVALGLLTGQGAAGTVEAVTAGFGAIMAEVGLLIAFGVLIGALLGRLGAIQRLVDRLLELFGPQRLPYSMSLTIGTLLQSSFLDVLLVISAPIARRLSPHLGPLGTPRMATALAIGLECGIVFMVPGVATLALAGLLDVPLGAMLVSGLLLIVPTIVISVAIMTALFRRGFWDPAKDETEMPPTGEAVADGPAADGPAADAQADDAQTDPARPGDGAVGTRTRELPLMVLFAPVLGALLLIATGAVLSVAGVSSPVTDLITQPVVALLVGLVGTSVVARIAVGREQVEEAVASGFQESGQILILTGVGGCLAEVVARSGLGDILAGSFSANTFAPLVVVWAIAAALHVAVGSVTISAITAAGILAPAAPALGLDPVLIALAAGAGSLFLVHVTSNTFWLLQSLLGQTTRGTLKTCSVGVSVASVVALLLILPADLLLGLLT